MTQDDIVDLAQDWAAPNFQFVFRDALELELFARRVIAARNAADSHGRYWLENRGRIIDAVTAAGFRIMSNADRCWLQPLPAPPHQGAE